MDTHSKEVRSYNMSCIKGKNTRPELKVRKYLFARGFRFRKNDKRYPGTPDIVLPKYKTMIFVNGCFWHGHQGCRYFVIPKSNTDFWLRKITRNITNDGKNTTLLKEMGWQVITVWECMLKPAVAEETLEKLAKQIRGE